MRQRLHDTGERKETELLVFVKAKDLAQYILLVSGKSPVKYRYSLLNPLINASLEIIELLYEANDLETKDPHRAESIRRAKTKLKTIDFLASVARDASCFTTHQYEVIEEKIGVCSRYVLGYYNASRTAAAK